MKRDTLEQTLKDVYDSFTEDQKNYLCNWVAWVIANPDEDYPKPEAWERKIFGSMTDEQKEFCYLMVAIARMDDHLRECLEL